MLLLLLETVFASFSASFLVLPLERRRGPSLEDELRVDDLAFTFPAYKGGATRLRPDALEAERDPLGLGIVPLGTTLRHGALDPDPERSLERLADLFRWLPARSLECRDPDPLEVGLGGLLLFSAIMVAARLRSLHDRRSTCKRQVRYQALRLITCHLQWVSGFDVLYCACAL